MRRKRDIIDDLYRDYGDRDEQIELFLEVLIDIRDILKGKNELHKNND